MSKADAGDTDVEAAGEEDVEAAGEEDVDPLDALPFDPKRLITGDRVIVDFAKIDSYSKTYERVGGLSHLDLDPAGDRGPRFKAVIPFRGDRNGGWECGGPLDAIRPANGSTDSENTD